MAEKNTNDGLNLSESDQTTEADRQCALESRRRFVRNTLMAGGLIAASLKTGVRPALAQPTTIEPTTTTTPAPTTTPGPTTTTTPAPTTTPGPTTTTTPAPTTTIGPTTTPAPLPSTLAPAPAMTIGGLAALAAALGLIVKKRLQALSTPDADRSKPSDDSGDTD